MEILLENEDPQQTSLQLAKIPHLETAVQMAFNVWTHASGYCCAYLKVCFLMQGNLFYVVTKIHTQNGERRLERFDCAASGDCRDYACGRWLPSLTSLKVYWIWINEVGMFSSCQTHAGCFFWGWMGVGGMLAEYREQVLDWRQLRKFNLENSGQSLMRHQLIQYKVKWARWQHVTLISTKAVWQWEYCNPL